MSKIIRKNYTLIGDADQGVVRIGGKIDDGYDELTIKQIYLSNIAANPNAVYCTNLNSAIGLIAPSGPSKPDFHFNIKNQPFTLPWEFYITVPNGSTYNTNESLAIDIEISKVSKE